MFITLLSDYVYVVAMLKTTPLVVTVGLSLTIPLAIVGDLFLHVPTALQAVFGGFLVVASFIVVGIEDSKMKARDQQTQLTEEVDMVDECDPSGES